ncbi:MAG: hypothetical protein HY900_11765 [Deltaproteobacteria bacterium]|nr:hypothetical protein [Deltaproteobacteria bacterium]
MRFPERHGIVYPGHPVALAVLIMAKYDSLDRAVALGYEFPCALEDDDIPGTGDSIATSLALLKSIARGEDPAKAVARADRLWRLGGAGGHLNAVGPGQEQAEGLKSLFFRMVPHWVQPTTAPAPPPMQGERQVGTFAT